MVRPVAAVAGAGVVGLAVGAALARRGCEVYVLERQGLIGSEISARNSEVIHAGMYYPRGSMKARHCVAGRRRLYAYCEARGVPHWKCGKLIVATTADEVAGLEAILAQGAVNGVEGLGMISRDAALAMEPELSCEAALLSSETGIIDSHGLMLALKGEIEGEGGWVVLHAPVTRVSGDGPPWTVRVGGAEPYALECDLFVNAGGMDAWSVAAGVEAMASHLIPARVLAKGSYFRFARGKAPFSRLIYPCPVDGGLGVHITLDMGGAMRFGPDVEWRDDIDYVVDPRRAESFYAAIRRYWPGLPDGSLLPDYSGYRPKLGGPGVVTDFTLLSPSEHGLRGMVHLFGIESPGLTSSLSLAEAVADAALGAGALDPHRLSESQKHVV